MAQQMREQFGSSTRKNQSAGIKKQDKTAQINTAKQQQKSAIQTYEDCAGKAQRQERTVLELDPALNPWVRYTRQNQETGLRRLSREYSTASTQEDADRIRTAYEKKYGEYQNFQQLSQGAYAKSVQDLQNVYAQTDESYQRAKKADERYTRLLRSYDGETGGLSGNVKADLRQMHEASYSAYEDTIANYDAEIAGVQKEMDAYRNKGEYPEGINAVFQYYDGLEEKKKKLESEKAETQAALEFQKKYGGLEYEDDFDRLSQYKSTKNGKAVTYITGTSILSERGFDDLLYDYVNKNPEAIELNDSQNTVTGATGAGVDDSFLKQMTDGEVKRYNYLYQKRGKDAAEEYLKALENTLTARQRVEDEKKNRQEAREHPVLTSAFSVLTNPLNGLSYIGQLADYVDDGKIDQNAGYNKFSLQNTAVRDEVSKIAEENWGKPGSFLYQTGMSMADFAYNALISGSFSGGAVPAELASNLSLAIMGSGAAASATIEAKNRGLSDGRSLALGTIAGFAEVATEKASLEKLLDKTSLGKNALGYWLQNVVAEGSEEVASDMINLFADIMISKDKSKWQSAVNAYIDEGHSEEKAFALAVRDQVIETGLSGLGGALSGGVMAGGALAVNGIQNGVENRSIYKDAVKNGQTYYALNQLTKGELARQNGYMDIEQDYKTPIKSSELTRALEQEGLSQGAIENLLGNQGETAPKMQGQAQPQYSIETTPDGKHYVKADRQVISGDDPKQWAGQITNYINQQIRNGQDITLTTNDGDLLQITRDTAGKAQFRNLVKQADGKYAPMSDSQYAAKLRAEGHIDELAEISTRGKKTVPDRNGKHGKLASDGWNYRTAFFEDADGSYYRLRISVAQGKSGNTIYNIANIERRLPAGGESEGKTSVALPFYGSSANSGALNQFRESSNNSIPNSSKNVNGKSYLSLRGLDPVAAGQMQRQMAGVKTDLEKSAVRWGVPADRVKAISGIAGNVKVVFDGTLKGNVNGYYQDGVIHLNPSLSSNQAVLTVFGHELTHSLEKTSSYRELANLVLNQIGNETAVRNAVNEKIEAYRRNGVELNTTGAVRELVAEYAAENLFSDEQLVRRMAQEKPSLAKKILSWIRETLAKLKNDTEKAQLLQAERLYSRMLEEAKKSDRVESTKFSLRQFNDGTRFVEVDTDQHLFDGLSEQEKTKLAVKLIKERFSGKAIGQDNRVYVNSRSAQEYGYPARSISGEVRDAKSRAATELDNLVDAGRNHRAALDGADGHVHPNAVGGFEYYDVIFKVGNEYYNGVINIQNTAKGRLLKDVTKIENVTQDISSSYGNNPQSTFLRNASTDSIRQSPQNINPPSQKKRYSFAGEQAKGADRSALSRAKAMQAQGIDSERIRQETGWFQGMDGQWRFEIDDSQMQIKPVDINKGEAEIKEAKARFLAAQEELMDRSGVTSKDAAEFREYLRIRQNDSEKAEQIYARLSGASFGAQFRESIAALENLENAQKNNDLLLGDLLNHPQLYRNYPSLARVPVRFGQMNGTKLGSFDGTVLRLSTALLQDKAELKNVLIHEIQHAVQETENFARGSNPDYWNEKAENGYSKKWNGSFIEMTPSELYENTAGEIEARNAADRQGFNTAQRRNTAPDLGDENTVFADEDIASYAQNVNREGRQYSISENEQSRRSDRQKVSQVRENTFENSNDIFTKADLAAKQMKKENFTYDVVTEQASMQEARERLVAGYEAEVERVQNRAFWRSTDLDSAMEILRRKNLEARETGDFTRVAEWAKLIQEKGTNAGQMIQAFAKYSRTPEGILTMATRNLKKLVDMGEIDVDDMNDILHDMAEFTETLDTIEEGSNGDLVDLIVRQAERRNTKVSKGTLRRLNAEPDFRYLYDFALTQLENIAADFEPSTFGKKLSTYQTIAHLFNFRTGTRNVGSNQGFDLVDTLANNISILPDLFLGVFTGNRTVGFEKSWFSKMKREGAKQGFRHGSLEASLDVAPHSSDGKSKYGTGGRRTWKANSQTRTGRAMSTIEKAMGYELNVTDEFHKGSVRGEVLESLQRFVENGTMTQEEALEFAEQEALYRSFQDDTLPGAILASLKDTMNLIGIGDSGRTLHGISIKEFGLGDFVQKYTQVPGALISRAVEFSPMGYLKAIAVLAKEMWKTRGQAKKIQLPKESADLNTTHPPEMQKIMREYANAVDPELRNFVRDGIDGKLYPKAKYYLDNVTAKTAKDISSLTGIDVSGFKTVFDSGSVDHINRRHGANGTADHSMQNIDDIARIQYVLNNYDTVEHTRDTTAKINNSDNTPAQVIKFSKRVDGTYYIAEAVSNSSRQELNILTAYKTKAAASSQAPGVRASGHTSKTAHAYETSAFDNSISNPAGKVNRIGIQAQRKAALAIGRATTGTGLITAFAALAASGILRRGDDEKDKDAAALNSAEGVGGTQINLSAIGRLLNGEVPEWRSGDVAFDLGFMEPLNAAMTLGSMVAQDTSDKGYLSKLADNSYKSLFMAIKDTPTMQTLDSIYNAIQYHDEETDLPQWLEIPITVAESGITGFVPSLVRQAAQATDQNYRDQYSSQDQLTQIGDKLKNTIPGLRETLPEKLDNFGRPKTYSNPWLNAFNATMFPGNMTIYKQDDVSKELTKVYQKTGNPNIYPDRSAPYQVRFGEESIVLTTEDRETYQKTRGTLTKTTMADLMQSEAYKKAGDFEKAELLKAAVDFANDLAKREFAQNRGKSYTTTTWDKTIEALENGISFGDYQSWKQSTQGMKDGEKRKVLSETNLPDNVKAELYDMDISNSHGEKISAMTGAGLSFNEFLKVQDKYSDVGSDELMKAKDKATEFSYWVDRQGYTAGQAQAIKENFKFFTMSPAKAGKYDQLSGAGIDAETAYQMNEELDDLEPEIGKAQVSDSQKLEQIAFSGDYSEENRKAALSVLMGDDYAKVEEAGNQGIGLEAYMDYYLGTKELKGDIGENGKTISGSKREKVLNYIDQIPDLTSEQKDYLYRQKGYAESKLEEAPWHSGTQSGNTASKHYTRRSGTGKTSGRKAAKNPFSNVNIGTTSASFSGTRKALSITLPTVKRLTRSQSRAKKITLPMGAGLTSHVTQNQTEPRFIKM